VAVYGAPLALITVVYLARRRRADHSGIAIRDEAFRAGLTEPPSLHPVIDPNICVGSGACESACPEGNVIRVIGDKAELVQPTSCIGHGACMAACPMGAISLVFGTERRGVDIPIVAPDFETNVPGVFIAGELGGMGLIRNAVNQGRQAMESIARSVRSGHAAQFDVVIVGAGPAGISASLAALQQGLRFVTLEQDTFGGTVAHFPRNKLVMTAPAELPIFGKTSFTEVSKEELLDFWEGVARKTGLKVSYEERVDRITRSAFGFDVRSTKKSYSTRCVLLAIGRRGTPRTLGVPGEDLPKVVYRLIDPEQYQRQRVLVVGGGDSALEAAASVADERDTSVTLAYRGDAFTRAKPKNRSRVEEAERDGRLRVLLSSDVTQIGEGFVELAHNGEPMRLQNDWVIVCAGGILPTAFLKETGIVVETKFGTA